MQYKLAAMAAALILLSGCALHWPNKDFVDGDFEVIDTGLDQSFTNKIWLDNDNLIVNTLQLVPHARPKKLFRVVIFNLKQRSVRELIPMGDIHCVNEITRLAKVRTFSDVEDADGSGVDTYMRLSPDGKLTAYGLPSPYASPCRLTEPRKPERLQIFLRDGDGYIDRGKTGGGYSDENAVLYRPNQAPRELAVKGGDIQDVIYLPFRNQYLLNRRDFLTNRFQPRGEPDFIYMSPTGDITREPQPEKFAKVLGSWGNMLPTRDGVLLDRNGPGRGVPGLFLVQGERITRVFGANRAQVEGLNASPDGCKLAFTSYTDIAFLAKKTIKIIDVCQPQP